LEAINRLPELDRDRVRDGFDRRFTARRMAEAYVRHYRLLLMQPEDRTYLVRLTSATLVDIGALDLAALQYARGVDFSNMAGQRVMTRNKTIPHHGSLFGSRYSEISTVPTLLNRLGAMSFGTAWLRGGSGRLASAQPRKNQPSRNRSTPRPGCE
jgi:hypothetical protein